MDTSQPEQNSRPLRKAFTVIVFSLLAVLAPAQTARSSVRATETAAYAMLTSLLKEWNIDFSRRELMTDYGAFGASIEARFPAHPAGSEGGGIFVFAVPVFSPRQTDDAETPLNWGHELAFRLIDRLKAAPLPFETVIYFTGDSWTPYAGLNALFDDLYARDDCIVVYCDFPEPPVALTVVRKWGESAAPLELAEPLFRICAETGTPCFFGTGDSGVTDVINERGGDVPALYINGSTSARSIAAKTGGKIVPDDAAALLLRYAETITRNGAQETDINYVFFGVKQGGFFISGFTLVLAALFGVFLIVFLYFFLRIVTKSRLKRIFIPVLAAVVIAGAFVLLVTRENFFSPRAKTDTPPKITLAGTSAETYLTAGAESRILLERRIVSIDIDAALEPLHYRLFFTAGSERGSTETPFYSVYNAPVPYTVGAGRIEFMLGPYPPNPLKLEIALPLDLTGEFGIEALLDGDLSVTQTFAAVP